VFRCQQCSSSGGGRKLAFFCLGSRGCGGGVWWDCIARCPVVISKAFHGPYGLFGLQSPPVVGCVCRGGYEAHCLWGRDMLHWQGWWVVLAWHTQAFALPQAPPAVSVSRSTRCAEPSFTPPRFTTPPLRNTLTSQTHPISHSCRCQGPPICCVVSASSAIVVGSRALLAQRGRAQTTLCVCDCAVAGVGGACCVCCMGPRMLLALLYTECDMASQSVTWLHRV
jgi:hypothetical protein